MEGAEGARLVRTHAGGGLEEEEDDDDDDVAGSADSEREEDEGDGGEGGVLTREGLEEHEAELQQWALAALLSLSTEPAAREGLVLRGRVAPALLGVLLGGAPYAKELAAKVRRPCGRSARGPSHMLALGAPAVDAIQRGCDIEAGSCCCAVTVVVAQVLTNLAIPDRCKSVLVAQGAALVLVPLVRNGARSGVRRPTRRPCAIPSCLAALPRFTGRQRAKRLCGWPPASSGVRRGIGEHMRRHQGRQAGGVPRAAEPGPLGAQPRRDCVVRCRAGAAGPAVRGRGARL